MKPVQDHRLPYARRLNGIARAAVTLLPADDKAKALRVTASALEASVKVGADRTTMQLIGRARRQITAFASIEESDLAEALRDDAREALNRLAGMIRRNDPDPNYEEKVA